MGIFSHDLAEEAFWHKEDIMIFKSK